MKAKITSKSGKWTLTAEDGAVLYTAHADAGELVVSDAQHGGQAVRIADRGSEFLITAAGAACNAAVTRSVCSYAPVPDKTTSVSFTAESGLLRMLRHGGSWRICRDEQPIGEIAPGLRAAVLTLDDEAAALAALLFGLYVMIDEKERLVVEV